MTGWTTDELRRIGEAEELEIAPRRSDGSLRAPVPICEIGGASREYSRYPSYVPPMLAAPARATTLKLVPVQRAANT